MTVNVSFCYGPPNAAEIAWNLRNINNKAELTKKQTYRQIDPMQSA